MRLDHLLSRETYTKPKAWMSLRSTLWHLTLFGFERSVIYKIIISHYIKWAYSSAGLERTPDKREVDGSSPFRPILL